MLLVCSYQDCMNIRYSCSPITFFSLPKDHRRKIWIRNSGNKNLNNISDTSIRYFCEQHFNPKHIRRQFHRSTLYKFAEPYKYIPKANDLKALNNDTINIEEIECIQSNDQENNSILEDPMTNDNPVLSSESIHNNNTIEETINEYLITPNDEVEKQLDFAIKENSEMKIVAEENIIEEILINPPKESEPIQVTAQSEISKTVLVVESNEEEKYDSVPGKILQIESNNNDYENDKHFALSLVGNFQRLSAHKKAIAKIKILQYLTELEFNENKSPDKIAI